MIVSRQSMLTQKSCASQGSKGTCIRNSARSQTAHSLSGAAPVATKRRNFSARTATPSVAHASRGFSRKQQLSVTCEAVPEKMTVSITGATGLVGSRLVSKLASQGHKVRALTRNVNSARTKLPYPGVEVYGVSDWSEALKGSTGVVNLAGEAIATRWTPEHKREIKASRVNTTRSLVDALAAMTPTERPSVLVSASAVGFYGNSQTASFSEDSGAGNDYLAEICKEWEAAAQGAQEKAGVRTVVLRLGIVLAADGGALGKMMPVFQIFAGGPLGSGRQWMSWIHRDDVVELIVQALRNPAYSGIYNATAPQPVRMSELCSNMGTIMGRPSWLPVPDFALQTLLGEGATVVLEGQRVLPARTQAQGFTYKYPDVGSALRNLLK